MYIYIYLYTYVGTRVYIYIISMWPPRRTPNGKEALPGSHFLAYQMLLLGEVPRISTAIDPTRRTEPHAWRQAWIVRSSKSQTETERGRDALVYSRSLLQDMGSSAATASE